MLLSDPPWDGANWHPASIMVSQLVIADAFDVHNLIIGMNGPLY